MRAADRAAPGGPGAMGFLDSLLVYDTAKIVQIRDRRLGALYYSLLMLTLAFVVGYEMFYCNDHFDKRDVQGTPHLSIQQPTVKACNPAKAGCNSDFTSLTDLPYCSVYTGNSTVVSPKNRHQCIFADKFTLNPGGVSSGGLLVPTRIDGINQTRLCEPSAANNYTCQNEFKITDDSGVRYVADIERYTLLISHSYRRDTIGGNNNDLMGFYRECVRSGRGGAGAGVMDYLSTAVFGKQECPGGDYKIPIECLPGSDCSFRNGNGAPPFADDRASLAQGFRSASKQRAKRRQPAGTLETDVTEGGAAAPDVYAIPDGDVFSLRKLLELAGASLDQVSGPDKEPLRSAGSVLDIRVQYNNMHPFLSTFGDTSVGYEYRVALRPLHQLKEEIVTWVASDSSRRTIENRHGLYVVVQVGGSFGFFSLMNLLLMLTSALAILTIATVLTDQIALKLMSNRDYYASHKYDQADAPDEKEGYAGDV